MFKTDQGWVMEADGQDSAVCPGCQSISRSRHSRYWRSLKDLPVQGTPVILRLYVGRWRCRNAGCERQIFTQHLSEVCAPHARQTKRSGELIATVGRALGGRPGQRLMSRLGMPLSADTLIRRVKKAARRSALPHPIRVLGVDDWAWSKGQTFGTILVDLERSQVVDLLLTRSADSLVEWLAQYPEVTIVSRDRQGVYSEGARRGAPEAVQVADRFHLVLNLIQAVERHLAVNRRHLRIARPSAPLLPPSSTKEECNSSSPERTLASGCSGHVLGFYLSTWKSVRRRKCNDPGRLGRGLGRKLCPCLGDRGRYGSDCRILCHRVRSRGERRRFLEAGCHGLSYRIRQRTLWFFGAGLALLRAI